MGKGLDSFLPVKDICLSVDVIFWFYEGMGRLIFLTQYEIVISLCRATMWELWGDHSRFIGNVNWCLYCLQQQRSGGIYSVRGEIFIL